MAGTEPRPPARGRANVEVRLSGRRLTYSWPPSRRGLVPRILSAAVLLVVAVAALLLFAAVLVALLVLVAAVALAALVLGARSSRGRPRRP